MHGETLQAVEQSEERDLLVQMTIGTGEGLTNGREELFAEVQRRGIGLQFAGSEQLTVEQTGEKTNLLSIALQKRRADALDQRFSVQPLRIDRGDVVENRQGGDENVLLEWFEQQQRRRSADETLEVSGQGSEETQLMDLASCVVARQEVSQTLQEVPQWHSCSTLDECVEQ